MLSLSYRWFGRLNENDFFFSVVFTPDHLYFPYLDIIYAAKSSCPLAMVVGIWISNRYFIWNCHRTLVFSIKWLVVLSTKKNTHKKMVSRVLFFICYPLANLRVLSFEFLWCPVIAVTRDIFDPSLRCSNHQPTDGAMPAPHLSSQNLQDSMLSLPIL